MIYQDKQNKKSRVYHALCGIISLRENNITSVEHAHKEE